MKMFKLLAVAFLGLSVMILVGCGSKGKTPEDVAVAYIELAYKGDADGMIKLIYLPKEDMKNGGQEIVLGKLKQAATKSAAEAERKGGVKKVSVEKSEIDEPNGTGSVSLVTEFKNDGSQSAKNRVRVIRSDGKWKINI